MAQQTALSVMAIPGPVRSFVAKVAVVSALVVFPDGKTISIIGLASASMSAIGPASASVVNIGPVTKTLTKPT